MPDYQKGLIYKIVALNCEDPEQVYYGSTVQGLAKRMGLHRYLFNQWKENKTNFTTSYTLFEKYGVENCKIILVENCPRNSKYELQAKEAEHILNNKCVNKVIPNRTIKQYYADNRDQKIEYQKDYNENNANKINKRKKLYRAKNTDKIKENNKKYREENADKIKEHKKQYYKNNADKIKENTKQYKEENADKIKEHKNVKYICECGGKYTHNHKSRHLKTLLHQTFISKQSITNEFLI